MKPTQISTLVAAAVLSLAANAEPFYLVVPDGEIATGDADKQTADAYQFGVNFSATSTYSDTDGSYDGSDASTFVTISDTVLDTGFGKIDTLLQSNGTSWSGLSNIEALGTNWSLSFEYEMDGVVAVVDNTGLPDVQGIGAFYGDGVVDGDNLIQIYYVKLNPGDGEVVSSTHVMNLEVLSSTGTIGNFVLNAAVDFTGVVDTTLAQSLFFFADNTNWFDLWTVGQPLPGIEINARVDTNVDPQEVPEVQLNGTAERTNTLNGSVEFNRVPEPATLALLGLGLVGLGLARRNKKVA